MTKQFQEIHSNILIFTKDNSEFILFPEFWRISVNGVKLFIH